MNMNTGAGPLLTNQFSFNSGVHYSFAANVKTISFADSPAPVLSCRNKLISAAQRIVQVPTDALFNEVMSVSYKSGGKMNYHNDGEEAVGPVIATQSLGSGTRMQFRERSSKASLKPGKKHHHSIVQLVLLHGDILIMEGDQFQAKYEHCIDPTSGLRFGKSRFILVALSYVDLTE
jgi:alkylated DNA repair dioxygenase AlkB